MCIAPPPLFGMTNPGQQQNKRFVKPLDCNRFCPDGSSSFRRWPEPRNWPQHWADPWIHNFQGDISLDHVAWFDFMICASLQFCDQLAETYRNMLRFDPLNRTHHYSCLFVCQTKWRGTGSDLSRCRSSRKQLPAVVHFGSTPTSEISLLSKGKSEKHKSDTWRCLAGLAYASLKI